MCTFLEVSWERALYLAWDLREAIRELSSGVPGLTLPVSVVGRGTVEGPGIVVVLSMVGGRFFVD